MTTKPTPLVTAHPDTPVSQPTSGSGAHLAPLTMLGILLLGWGIRLTVFEARQLGEDGLSSVGIARLDWEHLLAFTLRDIHPPLYYWALGRWLDLLGPSFFAARWLSLAADAVLVSLLFRTTGWRLGDRTALAAAALWVTVPAGFLAGATVRDFIAGALASLASWAFLLRASRSRAHRAGLTLMTLLAFMTWYFQAITWLLQIAVARRSRSELGALLIGGILAAPWYGAVALSWLPRWGSDRFGGSGPIGADSPVLTYFAGAGRTLLGDLPGGGVPAVVIWAWLVGFGLIQLWRTSRQLAALLGLGTIFGLLITVGIAAAWGGPDFVPRYFLVAVLYCVPVIAYGLSAIPARFGLVALLLIALPGLATYAEFTRIRLVDPSRSRVAQALIERTSLDDLSIFDNFELESYFWLAQPAGARTRSFHTFGVSYWYDRDLDRPLRMAQTTAGTVRWIVHDANNDQFARLFESELASRLSPIGGSKVEGLAIKEFRGPARFQRVNALFGGSVRLTEAQISSAEPVCRLVPITLRWLASRPQADDLTVFVHVIAADGRRVGQDDSPPTLGTDRTFDPARTQPATDVHWIAIDPATPAGSYQVNVGLYDDTSHLALPNGAEQLTIGQIRIEGPCRE